LLQATWCLVPAARCLGTSSVHGTAVSPPWCPAWCHGVHPPSAASAAALLPRRLCELNVKKQVFQVCTSPVVQAAWATGQQVSVYGMIYSLKDGLLKKLVGPISR
jgi:hypothetical protein